MARRVRLWPATALIVMTVAACTSEVSTEVADRVAASTAALVPMSKAEVTPIFLQFDAEKTRASASDLPDQF
jgi:hypothetical protein